MIIVSQSRRMIINLESILGLGLSSLEDKSIAIKMYESNDRVGTTIARYETAERAQEVLQEIVSKYRQYNLDNNKAVTILPKVYEMPKE
ncbi:MAG: hypothetical protein HFJ53_01105 [Clostridia bacterium]|nr:hypothetical protein [Clostridia bacterium]